MREKSLLAVYRLSANGPPVRQVSDEDIQAALDKRDRMTAYGTAIAIEDVADAVDQRWNAGHEAFLNRLRESLFGEPFSLPDVFVEPIGYWSEFVSDPEDDDAPSDVESPRTSTAPRRDGSGKPLHEKRHVIRVLEALKEWLGQSQDNVRILVGPPGAGKSSTARMFAAEVIEKGGRNVLFIPLHRLDLNLPVAAALDKAASELLYPPGVLDPKAEHGPTLLILDGLDELSQQGEGGRQAAQAFAEDVKYALDRCLRAHRSLHILFCGRPIAADHAAEVFRDVKQLYHLLPFFIAKGDRSPNGVAYLGPKAELKIDRRDEWWKRYALALGNSDTAMPEVLRDEKLAIFTAQPLLNFLLALAYRDRETPSKTENAPENPVPPNPFTDDRVPRRMADVYAWLLRKVYDREYESSRHPLIAKVPFADFRDLLGLLGLAAWHTGDGRTATVADAERIAVPLRLTGLLEDYRKSCQTGTTGLFLTFYFRSVGRVPGAKETYEFSIKPFAEHLAAVGIVTAIADAAVRLGKSKNPMDRRNKEVWDENELLWEWLQITGSGVLTAELFEHLCGEVARRVAQEQADAKSWRDAAVALLNYVLQHQFPAEKLKDVPFREMSEQTARAEHALLCVIGACTRALRSNQDRHSPPQHPGVLGDKSDESRWREEYQKWLVEQSWLVRIDWPSKTAAADLIRRIRKQSEKFWERSDLLPLLDLELSEQWLQGCDLSKAILEGASLDGARLDGASLAGARLDGASLTGARLDGAILERAILDKALLDRTSLAGARLDGARLHAASLAGARLDGAFLDGASLIGASLDRADLTGASLDRAVLTGASLVGAILARSSLQVAFLEQAILDRAILDRAVLDRAVLDRTRLVEVSLVGAICEGVRLDTTKKGRELLRSKGAILE
ncbi:pentapeptide repeat-containing protein [Fimbriiglobus ruber]|nr:pentapeptide repeat-containing protein [Fimbriiglobus ruber]